MAGKTKTAEAPAVNRGGFWFAALLMAFVLVMLFNKAFTAGHTVFSNDGPLGLISAESSSLPEGYFGVWSDLNWLGSRGIGATPTISSVLAWITGPLMFSKVYPIVSLLVLGLATWLLFRQLGFSHLTCILGGLASILNTSALSIACWGLPPWVLARAMIVFALAVLVSRRGNRWVRAALAGMAVGMAVSEGFDVGAIFSLVVAAFVLFQSLIEPRPPGQKALFGGLRLVLVAGFAAFLAAQSLSALIATQVRGIAGTAQDEDTRQQQWDFATQWSLPPIETLRVLVGGLFGYRMDTPEGGNYWGTVGRQPGWEQHRQGFPRHSGAGEYAGVLVVLVAFWAVFQSFRGEKSVFDEKQRKHIRFWMIAAVICLLFAFGRHAPFYKLIYALPFFSTIRNPVKWMYPFHLALLILFGYGLHGLTRCCLLEGQRKAESLGGHLKAWWAAANAFEKKWSKGLFAFIGVSILGWLIYTSSRSELERYLAENGLPQPVAGQIASFSFKEVGWYVFFLILSVAAIIVVMSGWFAGHRSKWAGLLVGAVLVSDLARANQPWIQIYNWKEKYASNPVLDYLRREPYKGRVALLPIPGEMVPGMGDMRQVYQIFWHQHHFPYYNIQSFEVVQEPRVGEDKVAFQTVLPGRGGDPQKMIRTWELTSTRYFFGTANIREILNQQFDPGKNRFRVHTLFDMGQERIDGPIMVQTNNAGPFALYEFTGALPRASLYSDWQVITNEDETLQRLASPEFDPHRSVLVADETPAPAATGGTNAPGTVEITDYAPKTIRLKSDSAVATVLLMTDRFDPHWRVLVDGEEEQVLRCNFIMRGVYLPAGSHEIEFRFEPPIGGLYISLTAIAIGAVLLVILLVSPREEEKQSPGGHGREDPLPVDRR